MKRGLIVIALLLLSYITSAATIAEFNFAQQGYKDFYISSVDSPSCTKFDFALPPDVNGEAFAIFSLSADFGVQPKNAAILEVFLNGESLYSLNFRDFKDRVVRLDFPIEKLANSNSIRVCGKAALESMPIRVDSDSSFGVYTGAYFPPQKGFVLELETYSPFVGIPFRADVVAKNFGSEDAQVLLTYRRQELEENTPEISVLKGETSKSGTAPKCRERDGKGICTKPGEYVMEYEIVANKAVPFTLLPARMIFTNVFGEEERFTNRPTLAASEPPHKLSVNMAFGGDTLVAGNEIELRMRVQNISRQRVEGIRVFPKAGMEIIGDSEKAIDSLNAGETSEVLFAAKAAAPGNYAIGCTAGYEGRTLECESTSVTVQPGIDVRTGASIVLALISIAVFAYLYFKKE